MKRTGSDKFAPTRVARLWQINPRYKHDPGPNNKTNRINQKVSFQFWNSLYSIHIPWHHAGLWWKYNWTLFYQRVKVVQFIFWTPWHRSLYFQQVQCAPVATGHWRELQFCHQWSEEKFSPVSALLPQPQWSRHHHRRWTSLIFARKTKKVPDDKNN